MAKWESPGRRLLTAIVLDFDGVVLESAEIKTRAFRELFKDHPKELGQILQYHEANGGVSRHEKFEVIYRDYLQVPLPVETRDRLAESFALLVSREIDTCPFVSGVLPFLEHLGARMPIYIVSGTPQDELEGIVERRGLRAHFRAVYGSPPGKSVLLRTILEQHAWRSSEIVCIGDSLTDYAAASAVAIPFVGRLRPGFENPFPDTVHSLIQDFTDLPSCLANLMNDAKR